MIPSLTVEERCQRAGMSLAQLARRSGVPYRKVWEGSRLQADEAEALERVLDAAEREAEGNK